MSDDKAPRLPSSGESRAGEGENETSEAAAPTLVSPPWSGARGPVTLASPVLMAWRSSSFRAIPAPVPPSAPDSVSSSGSHVVRIASEAHPPGSPAHAGVRQYLLAQLRALGHEPVVQTTTAATRDGTAVAAADPLSVPPPVVEVLPGAAGVSDDLRVSVTSEIGAEMMFFLFGEAGPRLAVFNGTTGDGGGAPAAARALGHSPGGRLPRSRGRPGGQRSRVCGGRAPPASPRACRGRDLRPAARARSRHPHAVGPCDDSDAGEDWRLLRSARDRSAPSSTWTTLRPPSTILPSIIPASGPPRVSGPRLARCGTGDRGIRANSRALVRRRSPGSPGAGRRLRPAQPL